MVQPFAGGPQFGRGAKVVAELLRAERGRTHSAVLLSTMGNPPRGNYYSSTRVQGLTDEKRILEREGGD